MRRTALLLVALLSLSTAIMLMMSAGLPGRARYNLRPGELPVAPEIGAIAPSFELPSLHGNRLSLDQLRGSPIIVNFWATWCEPCRVEMPFLQSLYDQHYDQGLRVLAVNLGEGEDAVQDWVTEMRLTFDIFLDDQQQVADLYQLRGVPSTYVVTPNGAITAIFYGPTTESQLQTAIAPLIGLGYTPAQSLNTEV